MSTTQQPRLDAPVAPFSLTPSDGGGSVALDDLIASGPAVLALIDGGRTDDARAAMLRELGQRMAGSPARLLVVSPGDSALGRQLGVVRVAEWMTDPKGEAGRALGMVDERRLRRAKRRDGLFVVDQERVLRFAFAVQEKDQCGRVCPGSGRPRRSSSGLRIPLPPARRSWMRLFARSAG